MLGKRRFVIRTIKNGQVKILGKVYHPNSHYMEYDGRLDGMRYAFGLYYDCKGELEEFVSLCGAEKAYKAPGDEDIDWPDPECVDGYYHWAWWDTENYKPYRPTRQDEPI